MHDRLTADEVLALGHQNWLHHYHHVDRFAVYLNRVRELSDAEVNQLLGRFGISHTEFDILATLRCTAPPHTLTPTGLRRSMLITSGGLTKLLHGLEHRALISRSVQEHDRRSKLVHLTDTGRRLAEEAMEEILRLTDQWLTESLDMEEIETLNRLLGKLNRSLEERIEAGVAGKSVPERRTGA